MKGPPAAFQAEDRGVRLSLPAPEFGSVAQWTRAAGFYPVGWGFESLRDRQIYFAVCMIGVKVAQKISNLLVRVRIPYHAPCLW